nr:hypothetical protein [uncultured Oscillibacter sp.]
MRHLFATLSLENGVDVKTLCSIPQASRSTLHPATAQMKQDAADAVGAVIGSQM